MPGMSSPPAKPKKPLPSGLFKTAAQYAELAVFYAKPNPDETAEQLRIRQLRTRYNARMSRHALRWEQLVLDRALERELQVAGNLLSWTERAK